MAEKILDSQPLVHPEAVVLESQLGAWTEVGARASLTETVLGDYSYVIHDSDIIYTRDREILLHRILCSHQSGKSPFGASRIAPFLLSQPPVRAGRR